MVTFGIHEGIRLVADSILVVTSKGIDVKWFAEDITIKLSKTNIIAPIVVDFTYDVSSIIEFTLTGGAPWNPLNNGSAIDGAQSLFIRVTDGDIVNFRAKTAGNINRVVVSVP